MKQKTTDTLSKETLTENNINLLKNRVNKDIEILKMKEWKTEYKITDEQTEKGKKWLFSKYLTPQTEKERKHNPFNNTQIDILKDFSHFTFNGLANISHSSFVNHFMPIYSVYDTKGNYFQYHINNRDAKGITITE